MTAFILTKRCFQQKRKKKKTHNPATIFLLIKSVILPQWTWFNKLSIPLGNITAGKQARKQMLRFQHSQAAYNPLDKNHLHISHKLKIKSLNVKAYSENLPGTPVKETLCPDGEDPNKQIPVKS